MMLIRVTYRYPLIVIIIIKAIATRSRIKTIMTPKKREEGIYYPKITIVIVAKLITHDYQNYF